MTLKTSTKPVSQQQQQQQQQQPPASEKTKTSSKCFEMQAYSLKNKTTPIACEPDGRFSALQVDLNLGYTWCVNQDTGLEIYGTRQLGGKPIKCPGTESRFI